MSTHVQFLSLTTDLVVAERHFPDDTADSQAQELAQLLANTNHEPTRRALAAGVLRAAADRIMGLIPDVHLRAFARGVEAAAAFAEAIATELEALPDD